MDKVLRRIMLSTVAAPAFVISILILALLNLVPLGEARVSSRSSSNGCDSLWPAPRSCHVVSSYACVVNPTFTINSGSSGSASEILMAAFDRYGALMFTRFDHRTRGPIEPHVTANGTKLQALHASEQHMQHPSPPSPPHLSSIRTSSSSSSEKDEEDQRFLQGVTVYVKHDNDEPKSLHSDESFLLEMQAPYSTITANTVWGAMYGLEALSQLVGYDADLEEWHAPVCHMTVQDSPRFPWRGLLLDTANHYLPVRSITDTLDAMSYNRLNVLHW